MSRPILYSFKRCPYAMRARIAIYLTNTICEIREVSLKNKPQTMLDASSKGTVPVLVLDDKNVIDESVDVVDWALKNNNIFKESLSRTQQSLTKKTIKLFDADFKFNLDRYKYATRYKNVDAYFHRDICLEALKDLEDLHSGSDWFFGNDLNMLDICVLPFIRQYRIADTEWFDQLDQIPLIKNWLNIFLESNLLKNIMISYEPWKVGDPIILFPKAQ